MTGFRNNPIYDGGEEDIDQADFEPRAKPSSHVYADGEEEIDEANFERPIPSFVDVFHRSSLDWNKSLCICIATVFILLQYAIITLCNNIIIQKFT